MAKSDPLLPITEVTYFILLSLKDAPKHGYAIIKDVQVRSEGRVSLSTGTLYGALKRLLGQGFIERVEDECKIDGASSRETKSYRLTSLGVDILEEEIHRLNLLLQAARASVYSGLQKS